MHVLEMSIWTFCLKNVLQAQTKDFANVYAKGLNVTGALIVEVGNSTLVSRNHLNFLQKTAGIVEETRRESKLGALELTDGDAKVVEQSSNVQLLADDSAKVAVLLADPTGNDVELTTMCVAANGMKNMLVAITRSSGVLREMVAADTAIRYWRGREMPDFVERVCTGRNGYMPTHVKSYRS